MANLAAQNPCSCCKGRTYVTVKMQDRSGRSNDSLPILGTVVCPACNGKGFITAADSARIQSVEQYDQIIG
jgi:hypothetical protein